MTPVTHLEISELEISFVNNKSKVTSSRIYKPLKVFPLYDQHVCHIVFSNYGGGFVGGDKIYLDLLLRPETTTVFSNQANTRIYKSEADEVSRQEVNGILEMGSFAVYLSDPVIAHKGSIFEQVSRWELASDAVLLAVDWFEAGRLLNDERFVFNSFISEMRIDINGEPVVWDKFKMHPEQINPNSPGVFLDHSCYLNIFLVGDEGLEKIKFIEEKLVEISGRHFHEENPLQVHHAGILGTSIRISNQAMIVRCSARSHDMIASIVKELAEVLANKSLLGFNPVARKF